MSGTQGGVPTKSLPDEVGVVIGHPQPLFAATLRDTEPTSAFKRMSPPDRSSP
jgi:hypothetical protein